MFELFTAPAALRAVTPLLIILVVAGTTWAVGQKRRVRFLREAALIIGAYFAYFGVRAISEGSSSIALHNARFLIALEKRAGLFIEPSVQGVLLSSQAFIDIVNWIYVWGHWPVIGAVAIWLFARKPNAYRTYRNALLISGGIGLIFYVSFPAAPPRFTNLGLVDTVFSQSTMAQLMQPTSFTNQYAAFPSLHFGWSLLMATAIFREAKRQPVRVVAWLLPLGMLVSIVATANHFVVDALAGGIVALVGLRAALMLERPGAFSWLHWPVPAASMPVALQTEQNHAVAAVDEVGALDIPA
ncbi:MAG: phosphatase PAP2 family protein [Chloroflexi bacterium]|nr:phosphatase PAP2 family protein [Chloroflexota bacterium]MDA1145972.1 phosphatase PAP2 family protein [Chloroflexota bacterium]